MTASNTSTFQRRVSVRLLITLGSMNLAIMLLVTIALASVIGTLLRQNEPYQNYIIKFGPWWHELYRALGLYDVYSSAWFIFILAFLVISTSVCVTRNAPQIIRSMRRYREDIHERVLLNLPEHQVWETPAAPHELQPLISRYLQCLGYRMKTRETSDSLTLAAMTGSSNRAGYLLTHIAIIIICVGGLLDGNLPLKIKTLSGALRIETRDLPVSDIPSSSILSGDNPTFRAGVSIPEGAKVNYAFINIAGGYLLQSLPFAIEVRDFRIEHYQNGQPKSFESDLVIHDPAGKDAIHKTIAVNHPLIFNGYTIYQSSFADGGSRLELLMRPFDDPGSVSLELSGTVNNTLEMGTSGGLMRLEFTDFRKYNIFPEAGDDSQKKFLDYGPSFSFKVRQTDGTAREYINYMYPVPVNERLYLISGVRASPESEFRYLHIPVDPEGTAQRFFRFLSYMNDDYKLKLAAEETARNAMEQTQTGLQEDLRTATLELLRLFRSGGFDAISIHMSRQVPEPDRPAILDAYSKILLSTLRVIYLQVLQDEAVNTESLDAGHGAFFDDAINAMNALQHYGAPFYLQLQGYEEKLATGLQITRTPGKKFVYAGFTMLICGVFLLFYIPHQRLWFILRPLPKGTHILMAGARHRHRHQFRREFHKLSRLLQDRLKPP